MEAGLSESHSAQGAFAVGLLLKLVDDYYDDGLWPKQLAWASQVGLVCIVYPAMLADARAACMMAAFTLTCWETGGLDTKYFQYCAAAVGVCLAVSWGLLHPAAAVDFHLHMTLFGTAYAGMKATQLDGIVEERWGRSIKFLFRLVLGCGVGAHRPFIPADALTQHSLLTGFILGYATGQAMALLQLHVFRRR
eukprot:TRINITY_DN20151_c0_g1_i1.p1 TRINITY_DN20151_c0_g1~~TRINITY_DN20151_c0_g1_i1.p1  ORF type:complete len:211 (+),score=74.07 TRINITY_DN20151_c0_g1_i1:55-633(+)